MGCAASRPYEPSEAELVAEEHEEHILEVSQRYHQQLEALRTQIAKAKEQYHVGLADETNRRLGHLSHTRKVVDTRQQSVQKLEQQYARTRRDMQDELADLRSAQRSAALRTLEPGYVRIERIEEART